MRGGVAIRQLHAAGRRTRGVQVLCLTRKPRGEHGKSRKHCCCRDWWVRDPDTLNLWDWAPWSFSMGFYANIGALFWATATLSVAALAVGWCGCLRFCAPEHEAKPNAVPTVVSESKDAP